MSNPCTTAQPHIFQAQEPSDEIAQRQHSLNLRCHEWKDLFVCFVSCLFCACVIASTHAAISLPFLAQGLVAFASLAHRQKARFADCGTLLAVHLGLYLFNTFLAWDLFPGGGGGGGERGVSAMRCDSTHFVKIVYKDFSPPPPPPLSQTSQRCCLVAGKPSNP